MTSTRPTINVLLVEDNPEDVDLVQEGLDAATEAQFEVHTACRLKEAHHQLAARQFDIVLLDLSLPDSSGLHTLETVLAWNTGLPIVVLSGLGEVTTVLHTLLHTLHYSTDQPIVVLSGSAEERLDTQVLELGGHAYLTKQLESYDRLPASLLSVVEQH